VIWIKPPKKVYGHILLSVAIDKQTFDKKPNVILSVQKKCFKEFPLFPQCMGQLIGGMHENVRTDILI
jgi:hypothetical protein